MRALDLEAPLPAAVPPLLPAPRVTGGGGRLRKRKSAVRMEGGKDVNLVSWCCFRYQVEVEIDGATMRKVKGDVDFTQFSPGQHVIIKECPNSVIERV